MQETTELKAQQQQLQDTQLDIQSQHSNIISDDLSKQLTPEMLTQIQQLQLQQQQQQQQLQHHPPHQHKEGYSKKKQLLIFSLPLTAFITFSFYITYHFLSITKLTLLTDNEPLTENANNSNNNNNTAILLGLIILYIILETPFILTVTTKASQTKVDKYFDSTFNNISNIDKNVPGKELKSLCVDEWIYCEFCKAKKFIRSSHCSTCKDCILLRDHHCPWVSNCIGFHNTQYFINFLIWALIAMTCYFIFYIRFVIVTKDHTGYTLYKVVGGFDLAVMIFFYMNVISVFLRMISGVYNNRMFVERRKNFMTEFYYPCCNGKDMTNNMFNYFNIGFVAHFYYCVGPTLLHFLFPIPKFQDFVLDVNCPVFRKSRQVTKMELAKYFYYMDEKYKNILNGPENEPEYYLKLCHQHYDNKIIV